MSHEKSNRQSHSPNGEATSTSEVVQEFLKLVWRLVWVALVLSVSFSVGAAFWLLPKDVQDNGSKILYCCAYFLSSFLANLASAAVVYLVSYGSIRKLRNLQDREAAQSMVVAPMEERVRLCVNDCFREWSAGGIREYQSVRKVNWAEVIRSADRSIDICVQGWDGLVKHNWEEWKEFFAKNGQVNLFLPSVPESIGESKILPFVAERLNRTEPEQAKEIRNTQEFLQQIRDQAKVGKVTLHPVEKMIWYCLIRVDEKVAYLSPYQHVYGPVTDSPTFEIWLDRYPATKGWIAKEINGLRSLPTSRTKQKRAL